MRMVAYFNETFVYLNNGSYYEMDTVNDLSIIFRLQMLKIFIVHCKMTILLELMLITKLKVLMEMMF